MTRNPTDMMLSIYSEREGVRGHGRLFQMFSPPLAGDRCSYWLLTVINNLFSASSDEVFSLALYHFNHTLVTSDLPSPALQVKEVVSSSVSWWISLTAILREQLQPISMPVNVYLLYTHAPCAQVSVCVFCFQSMLLQQLGVAPFSEGPWPLYIHPQSLSVLSRLLLIWQHKATQQGEPDVPECIKVWER